MTSRKCGISNTAPDFCREGVEENQEYCILNEKSGFCNKKDKRTYGKIIEEIRNKGGVVVEEKPVSAKAAVLLEKPVSAKPKSAVKTKKCGMSSSSPDFCREGVEENQEYCTFNEKSGACNKKDKRTYAKIIEEIMKKVGVIGKPVEEKKPVAEIVNEVAKVEEKGAVAEIPSPTRILTKDQDRSQALERYPCDSFRIYSLQNDFEGITDKSLGKGAYGATYRTKFKTTGQPVILKKFLNYDPFNVINNDIIKEIAFLQFLNQFPNAKAVGFYGLALDNKGIHIYLALQPLEKTLDQLWKQTVPPEQIRVIFYQILKAFSNIHGAGILHNDIKLPNIMIQGEDIRIIDFGLAEYLGVGPSTELMTNYLCTEVTKAPDHKSQMAYGFLSTNRKTYASDMYSIGATIVHLVIGNWWKVLVEGNNIFMMDMKTGRRIKNITGLLNSPDALGPEGYDLLLKIMNPDTHQRWCALEALRHPYFAGMPDYVPIDRAIVRGGAIEKLYSRQIHYTEEEYLNRQMELCYLEIQHQTFMDDKVKIVKLNPDSKWRNNYFIVIDWLLTVFTTRNLINGLDALVNCLQTINKNWNNVITKTGSRQIQLLAIISNHIACSIFNFNDIPIDNYEYVTGRAFTFDAAVDFVNNVLIVDNGAKLPILPISVHVQYIFLKLKYELKDSSIMPALEQLYIGISLHILFWFIQPDPFESVVTTWEIAVYSAIESLARILGMSPTELNQNPIIPILSIEDGKFVEMSNYLYKQMNDTDISKMCDKGLTEELKKLFYHKSK